MAFSEWPNRVAYDESPRRTNSLGFAKVDCHTCQARKTRCDRQRPQCGTCIKSRRKCGGFTMDLVWKDQKSKVSPATRDPNNTSSVLSQTSHDPQSLPDGNLRSRKRAIMFAGDRTKTRRKSRKRRSEPATFSVPVPPASDDRDLSNDSHHTEEQAEYDPFIFAHRSPARSETTMSSNADSYDALLEGVDTSWSSDYDIDQPRPQQYETELVSSFRHDLFTDMPLVEDQGPAEPIANDNASYEEFYELQIFRPQSLLKQPVVQTVHGQLIPQTILSQTLAEKFHTILDMYDEEFCILPLSTDCESNPFRVSLKQCERYPFLLHSVLALSFQHLAKQRKNPALAEETDRHRSTAVQLYSQALSHSTPSLLLDTLLILFNFEVTQSAFSGWTVHLRGAQKILEGMDIAETLGKNSRVRAQVATLVWWDITIAFISRKECRMPLQYLDMLIEHNHKDKWSFFALNGCHAELMIAMGKLAKLASIYEKAAKLEWTTFNTTPVDAIVEDVLRFRNEEDVSAVDVDESDSDPNARQDRLHCVEAWRYAILLYVRRVFRAEQDGCGLRAIDHLTRVILDHVRCIRPTARVQKQVLLPVFLAAAELGHEHPDREFVRSYCKHWSTTARYFQFESALSWLETIWLEWTISTRSTYWWGCKVGKIEGEDAEMREAGLSIGSELLLG